MRPSSKADAELYNTVQQSPLMERRRQKLYLQIVYPQLPHLWKPYCSKINADTALQHTTTVLGLLSSRTQVASDSALEKYFFLSLQYFCLYWMFLWVVVDSERVQIFQMILAFWFSFPTIELLFSGSQASLLDSTKKYGEKEAILKWKD